ncbi:hypothetical protein WJX81_000969 [Elliptochloris bilobata]|uniref:LON peptidase N-terminal domain and RING finger protein 1 n=1 Tax=Elliptochloris bilobata TaxID=381761 RepID=A0AAW1SD89_9CHLO
MSSHKWEEAAKQFTLALKQATEPADVAGLLCERSRSYASLSSHIRSIPAAQSEYAAINGLDPVMLAQLALKDAQRASSLTPDRVYPLVLQGKAYMLMERFADAKGALEQGLRIDPDDRKLKDALAILGRDWPSAAAAVAPAVDADWEGSAKRARTVGHCDDLECSLCSNMFFEPVTTPCGHSFCRACFARTTDHFNKCPLCRTVVHVGRELPVSVTLAAILERSFPEEYAARRAETRGLGAGSAGAGNASQAPLPLFVMSCVLPGETIGLNIFEPRYRLMVRRCMEGNRRFGMATLRAGNQLNEVATECEITECQPQPDGRYHLEIVGRRRFRIEEAWELDGYRVARPGVMADARPEAGSAEAAELEALTEQATQLVAQWIERVRRLLVGEVRVLELLRRAGERPPPGDHEALSFWVANLMPFKPSERARMLATSVTRERLAFQLTRLRQTDETNCCVM